MRSQDNYRIALLAAYAIGLNGFETLLPTPIPWLKLGLANIITLTTLLLYGLRPAIMVTLIRVIVVSMFTGTFLGPAFVLSLTAGLVSTAAMGIVRSLTPRLFSTLGISLVGAFFHNLTQLFLAYFLFIRKVEAILLIAPLFMLLGTVTGAVNGVISQMLIRSLRTAQQKVSCASK